MNDYVDIRRLKQFANLERGALHLLRNTVQTFFGCRVTLTDIPSVFAKSKFGIDIQENLRRGCYIINDDTIFLLGRIIHDRQVIAAIGIVLRKAKISISSKIFNVFEGGLTHKLSDSYMHNFKDAWHQLEDELIKLVISNYISKGYYDYHKVIYLINIMNQIRTTSFEGKFFSTGLILTRSHYAYNQKRGYSRAGSTHALSKSINLSLAKPVDRRFWYLADGKTSYFLCDRNLRITQLFILSNIYQETGRYLDTRLLPATLKGSDALLRIQNEKEFCIVTSSGAEFVFHENHWAYRDYEYINVILSDKLSIERNVASSLLFYLLYCSHHSISTIIWLPDDIETCHKMLKSYNQFTRDSISILDHVFTNHVIRILSSDGATMINKDGRIMYYGCIIDTAIAKIKGVKGTGETAASLLCSNGIAIKVSQDGSMRIYFSPKDEPVEV